MSHLPYPPEPSRETVRKCGNTYDEGVASFCGFESTDKDSVAKQGMIEYLADQWKNQSISRREVAKGCDAANTALLNSDPAQTSIGLRKTRSQKASTT